MHEALSHSGWKHAMIEEMVALHSTSTWDLVTLLAGKSPVVVIGFILLRSVWMVEWTILKLV